jgi:hypothetical protein
LPRKLKIIIAAPKHNTEVRPIRLSIPTQDTNEVSYGFSKGGRKCEQCVCVTFICSSGINADYNCITSLIGGGTATKVCRGYETTLHTEPDIIMELQNWPCTSSLATLDGCNAMVVELAMENRLRLYNHS